MVLEKKEKRRARQKLPRPLPNVFVSLLLLLLLLVPSLRLLCFALPAAMLHGAVRAALPRRAFQILSTQIADTRDDGLKKMCQKGFFELSNRRYQRGWAQKDVSKMHFLSSQIADARGVSVG